MRCEGAFLAVDACSTLGVLLLPLALVAASASRSRPLASGNSGVNSGRVGPLVPSLSGEGLGATNGGGGRKIIIIKLVAVPNDCPPPYAVHIFICILAARATGWLAITLSALGAAGRSTIRAGHGVHVLATL